VERPSSTPPEQPSRRPRPTRRELAAIFLGGFIGSLVRSALAHGFPVAAGQWPWPTFAVNMAAAATLGYLIARSQAQSPPSMYGRAFIGIGVCGALSTFSTLMVELLGMLESSRWGLAVGYGAASIAGGLAAVMLASRLARRAMAAP
jgi:CrcB protein